MQPPVVQIGALQFALNTAFTATMAPVSGRPFTHVDGDLVQVVEAAGRVYLVVDHRTEADTARPTYVEVWTQQTPGEASVQALLALSDRVRIRGELSPVAGRRSRQPAR